MYGTMTMPVNLQHDRQRGSKCSIYLGWLLHAGLRTATAASMLEYHVTESLCTILHYCNMLHFRHLCAAAAKAASKRLFRWQSRCLPFSHC